MTINFILGDDDKCVTPMNFADAILKSGEFTFEGLAELIEHLSVYIKHNQFRDERRK